LQLEIPEAYRSINGIKRRFAPVNPKRPLRRILDTIEPLIILQESVDRVVGDIREARCLRAHQAKALHAWIRADDPPIRQRPTTGATGFTTAARAEVFSIFRQIAHHGDFLSWEL